MKILSIETSCDETGMAILEFPQKKIIFEKLASQIEIHKETGGIIPERASRIHAEILPYFLKDIQKILNLKNIDYFAVTQSPGLLGSLLCGNNASKILGQIYQKPVIPINHILAHFYSAFLTESLKKLNYPALGLVVSGGHTVVILATKKNDKIKFKIIGETRDDAAGEAFDKIARLLGLGYPGGPKIQEAASKTKISRFKFTPPMLKSQDFDFSYSGLKTDVLRTVKNLHPVKSPSGHYALHKFDRVKSELAFAAQKAIVESLVEKSYQAVIKFKPKIFLLGGGVAANSYLRKKLKQKLSIIMPEDKIFFPLFKYSGDNASMVALAAYLTLQDKPYPWYSVRATSENVI